MAGITGLLFLLRAAAFALDPAGAGSGTELKGSIGTLNAFFYLGAFLSQFVANGLARVQPSR
jgi:hypothetical protein